MSTPIQPWLKGFIVSEVQAVLQWKQQLLLNPKIKIDPESARFRDDGSTFRNEVTDTSQQGRELQVVEFLSLQDPIVIVLSDSEARIKATLNSNAVTQWQSAIDDQAFDEDLKGDVLKVKQYTIITTAWGLKSDRIQLHVTALEYVRTKRGLGKPQPIASLAEVAKCLSNVQTFRAVAINREMNDDSSEALQSGRDVAISLPQKSMDFNDTIDTINTQGGPMLQTQVGETLQPRPPRRKTGPTFEEDGIELTNAPNLALPVRAQVNQKLLGIILGGNKAIKVDQRGTAVQEADNIVTSVDTARNLVRNDVVPVNENNTVSPTRGYVSNATQQSSQVVGPATKVSVSQSYPAHALPDHTIKAERAAAELPEQLGMTEQPSSSAHQQPAVRSERSSLLGRMSADVINLNKQPIAAHNAESVRPAQFSMSSEAKLKPRAVPHLYAAKKSQATPSLLDCCRIPEQQMTLLSNSKIWEASRSEHERVILPTDLLTSWDDEELILQQDHMHIEEGGDQRPRTQPDQPYVDDNEAALITKTTNKIGINLQPQTSTEADRSSEDEDLACSWHRSPLSSASPPPVSPSPPPRCDLPPDSSAPEQSASTALQPDSNHSSDEMLEQHVPRAVPTAPRAMRESNQHMRGLPGRYHNDRRAFFRQEQKKQWLERIYGRSQSSPFNAEDACTSYNAEYSKNDLTTADELKQLYIQEILKQRVCTTSDSQPKSLPQSPTRRQLPREHSRRIAPTLVHDSGSSLVQNNAQDQEATRGVIDEPHSSSIVGDGDEISHGSSGNLVAREENAIVSSTKEDEEAVTTRYGQDTVMMGGYQVGDDAKCTADYAAVVGQTVLEHEMDVDDDTEFEQPKPVLRMITPPDAHGYHGSRAHITKRRRISHFEHDRRVSNQSPKDRAKAKQVLHSAHIRDSGLARYRPDDTKSLAEDITEVTSTARIPEVVPRLRKMDKLPLSNKTSSAQRQQAIMTEQRTVTSEPEVHSELDLFMEAYTALGSGKGNTFSQSPRGEQSRQSRLKPNPLNWQF